MDRRESDVDPGRRNRRMREATLHHRARAVGERRDIFGRRRLKRDPPGSVVHDESEAGSKPPRAGPPIPSQDPVVNADQELPVPAECRVVGAPEDEAHRIAVTTNQGRVLLPHLRRTIAGQDPMHLFNCDRDALHRSGRRHHLGFEITPQAAGPRSRDRASIIQPRSPSVQLAGQFDGDAGVKWEQS